jgi:hypothetical protein
VSARRNKKSGTDLSEPIVEHSGKSIPLKRGAMLLRTCMTAFAAIGTIRVVVTVMLLATSAAGAQPAPSYQWINPNDWPNNYPGHPGGEKREWPDGPNKEFLKNLQRPDNWNNPSRWSNPDSLLCCDVGDTVKTKFKVEEGDGPHLEDRWYAWINGEWVLVPPEKIVPDYAPDGTPYLFMMAGTIQCFVRPRGGI